jgi:hypothetical protein
MPLHGVRYRVRTTPGGETVRLAFRDSTVVEAKNLRTGATHTPAEFARDRARTHAAVAHLIQRLTGGRRRA